MSVDPPFKKIPYPERKYQNSLYFFYNSITTSKKTSVIKTILALDQQLVWITHIDTKVFILNLKTNKQDTLEGHENPIKNIIANDKKTQIISYSKEVLRVWNANTLECTHLLTKYAGSISCVIFLSDQQIAIGLKNGTIKILDLNNQHEVCTLQSGHTQKILCLANYKNILISGAINETLYAWNLLTQQCIHATVLNSSVSCIVAFQNGRILCGSFGGLLTSMFRQQDIYLFEYFPKTNRVKQLGIHEVSPAKTPDGIDCIKNIIALPEGQFVTLSHNKIYLWDNNNNPTVLFPKKYKNSTLLGMALLPDGRLAVARSWTTIDIISFPFTLQQTEESSQENLQEERRRHGKSCSII